MNKFYTNNRNNRKVFKMKIGLLTIVTDKISEMKNFYKKVMGFEIIYDSDNYVEFTNEGVRFALCMREVLFKTTLDDSYKISPKGHTFELAFPVETPEEVNKYFNAIIAKGAIPIKEPEMMPWGRQTGFFADPDGNIHEIYSLLLEDIN